VIDRLGRLRHHTVVGRDDDHRNVVTFAPRARIAVNGLVARGVEEGDDLVAVVNLVGADVLRDAARFAAATSVSRTARAATLA